MLWSVRQSPPPIRTIAVLPFKPLVVETRDEALELGMAESLIAKLSTVKDITVRALSAVRSMAPKIRTQCSLVGPWA